MKRKNITSQSRLSLGLGCFHLDLFGPVVYVVKLVFRRKDSDVVEERHDCEKCKGKDMIVKSENWPDQEPINKG